MRNRRDVLEAGSRWIHCRLNRWIAALLWSCVPLLGLAQSAPYAHTQAAGPITTTNATLNGMVVPNGAETVAWFEWGASSNFGQKTASVLAGSGSAVVCVTARIGDLQPEFTFWSRLAASNMFGVVYGPSALFTSGQKVRTWGDNSYGQTNVPSGLSNVVVVAGADSHSLVVKSDGTVVAWGRNDLGQTNVPPGLSNVIAVAGGYGHSIALKSNGTVVSWGQNNYGQTNVPPGLTNAVAIAGGQNHCLALRANGTLVGWGGDGWGQSTIPPGLSNVVAVAAGSSFSVALKANGTVSAWGMNSFGQTNVPLGLSNVVAIAAHNANSLALRSDGTVVAWGSTTSGATNVPAGLSNVVAVARGSLHSLALKLDGTVVAWGSNFGVTNVPEGFRSLLAVAAGNYHSLVLGGNLPPSAQNQTNYGTASLDSVFTLSGTDANGDPLNYRVLTLPAAGALYQWALDGRGVPINAPGTTIDDPFGRVIFAPEIGASGWPYTSFSFMASDGELDSGAATAVVNITGVPFISVSSSSVASNGSFQLSFAGDTNASYHIWASTNLAAWSVLGSATQSPPGAFNFTDNDATNCPLRFYRVTCP